MTGQKELKKYNTIDQNNNPQADPRPTHDTSHPSNEVNSNAEFVDIMRKIPRILCERYELFDVLGKGAHGRIYLAVDLVTQERVAIKLVSVLLSVLTTCVDGEVQQKQVQVSTRDFFDEGHDEAG